MDFTLAGSNGRLVATAGATARVVRGHRRRRRWRSRSSTSRPTRWWRSSTPTTAATRDSPPAARPGSSGPVPQHDRHSNRRIRHAPIQSRSRLAGLAFASRSSPLRHPAALAQPSFGNPSPTAGSETSQKANAAADQTVYQPVEYVEREQEGAGAGRHPRRDQEQQRDASCRSSPPTTSPTSARSSSPAPTSRCWSARNLGPLLREFELAYNLGDPDAARKFLGMGKLKTTKYVVKFDILKTEQVASAQQGFDGRTLGQMAGALGAFSGSRGGARGGRGRRHRGGLGAQRARRPASGSSACATRSSTPRPPSRSRRATPRRRWRSARRRRRRSASTSRSRAASALDTMVQRLVQKSRVGNRQQVQVTCAVGTATPAAPASPFRARRGTSVGDDIDKLGKYEIRRELGRGAMGVVYEGYDPMIKRVVALKTIRADQLARRGSAATILARFRREAQAAGRLSHPEHRRDLRLRRGRRHLVHRDGVRARAASCKTYFDAQRALPDRRRRAHHGRDPRRARLLAPRRASSTATSSRRTSSCSTDGTREGRRLRHRARRVVEPDAGRARCSARRATCRPSRSSGCRSTAARTSSPPA